MATVIRRLLALFAGPRPGPVSPAPPIYRSAAVDAAGRAHLIRTLGHRIAIEAARETIIRHASERGGALELAGALWDTQRTNPRDVDTQFRVNRAATFLDLCGLLERSPGAPHIVRIRKDGWLDSPHRAADDRLR